MAGKYMGSTKRFQHIEAAPGARHADTRRYI
jgi:hypothetical protein